LARSGRWNPDAIERQLAQMGGKRRPARYKHAAEFWTERVAMMQAWTDYLDQLRYGTGEHGIQPLVRSQT
jgi:hypothetical protein